MTFNSKFTYLIFFSCISPIKKFSISIACLILNCFKVLNSGFFRVSSISGYNIYRNIYIYRNSSLYIIKLLEIFQCYFLVSLKLIRRKQISKFCQSFIIQHKINKSFTKVSRHYSIICLYSENICDKNFISYNFLNLLRIIFNIKTFKICYFIIFNKYSSPMSSNIIIFIKIYYLCLIVYSR